MPRKSSRIADDPRWISRVESTRDNAGRFLSGSGQPASVTIVAMNILLNGVEEQLPAESTIADLLTHSGYADRRVAVELNQAIVPRSAHATQRLQDGDRIEIVHAIGGG